MLRYLNNDLATGVGPLILMNITFCISSGVYLFYKSKLLFLPDLISLGIFTALWLSLLVTPLWQVNTYDLRLIWNI